MTRPNTRSSTIAAATHAKRKAQDDPSDNPVVQKRSKTTTAKASVKASAQDLQPDLKSKKPRARTSQKAKLPAPSTTTTAEADSPPAGPNYYLMKAEPNTRLENGIDVKFSIDDLQAATVPEPWEGVRNYVARNNMMAMKKGELAFFYHSNCKVPGIAGVMEVAEESCVDGEFECVRKNDEMGRVALMRGSTQKQRFILNIPITMQNPKKRRRAGI